MNNNIVSAADLQEYLRGLCKVSEPSVDKIIIGDPNTVIKKVATCWLSYTETLQKAFDDGVNVVITHEPTFYTHQDLDTVSRAFDYAPAGKAAYEIQIAKKIKWIKDHNMVVIRCHDVMDNIDKFGMPFALGNSLGFTNSDIRNRDTFYNVYQFAPEKAVTIAQRFADNLSDISQGLAFYGDENRIVSTVGVGTGCYCDPINFMHMNADMYIAIDDSIRTWVQTAYSRDTGLPMIVINHGTSEQNGMNLLCQYLSENTNLTCIHYKQGCSYKWINGNA